jgi:hypothetical protein
MPGTQVLIYAKNISANATVKFGALPAQARINMPAPGAAQITAIVPQGATSGHVTIVDSGRTLDCGLFTISTSAPPSTPPWTPPSTPPWTPPSTPPWTPPSTPPWTPPSTSSGATTVVSAYLEDTNGNNVVDQGDTLTVTFNNPVSVASSDPMGQIDLLVSGDTFGQGATMARGSSASDVVITLGANPHIRITGTYDPNATGTAPASGIDINYYANAIADGAGMAPQPGNGIDIESQSFAEGCFDAAASLVTPRGLHSATLLNDGRVLIVGGVSAQGPRGAFYVLENEIYDPTANTFMNVSNPSLGSAQPYMVRVDQAGQPFVCGRYAHAAVLLGDGRVLIAGGHGYEDRDTSSSPVYSELISSFVFDPASNSFSETGTLAAPRRDGTAVLFASGEVLIFGGRDMNGTIGGSEVYDPVSGGWSPGPGMQYDRYDETVVVTGSGILVCGGANEAGRQTASPSINDVTTDEWYDPSQGLFETTNSLNQARRSACGSLLGNGNAIIAGGVDGNGQTLASLEVFDVQSGLFTFTGSLSVARQRAVSRRLDDDVLVVGGVNYQNGSPSTVDSVETINASGSVGWFSVVYGGRLSHTVTHLADGRFLILGGFATPSNDISGMDGYAVGSAEFFTRP